MSTETEYRTEIEALLLLSALSFLYGFFILLFCLVATGLTLWNFGMSYVNVPTLLLLAFGIVVSIGNILNARFLQTPSNRQFTMMISVLNCLQFPFGALLGGCTIFQLMKPSVITLYNGNKTCVKTNNALHRSTTRCVFELVSVTGSCSVNATLSHLSLSADALHRSLTATIDT